MIIATPAGGAKFHERNEAFEVEETVGLSASSALREASQPEQSPAEVPTVWHPDDQGVLGSLPGCLLGPPPAEFLGQPLEVSPASSSRGQSLLGPPPRGNPALLPDG